MTWHVLTGEYPPDCGGVGDYSADLARALAETGDLVHVWTVGQTQAAQDGVAPCAGATHRRLHAPA